MDIKGHFKQTKNFIILEQQTDREIRSDLEDKITKNTLRRQDFML